MANKTKTKKKYWYHFVHEYCPVCGRGGTIKERRYTKKPKNIYKRHEDRESYDWCDAF